LNSSINGPSSGGGGEKKLFLTIVNVLGHPKGVGGLTSYFLRGGGMDVFWNDPFENISKILLNKENTFTTEHVINYFVTIKRNKWNIELFYKKNRTYQI
jgi:hypothetical protein